MAKSALRMPSRQCSSLSIDKNPIALSYAFWLESIIQMEFLMRESNTQSNNPRMRVRARFLFWHFVLRFDPDFDKQYLQPQQ